LKFNIDINSTDNNKSIYLLLLGLWDHLSKKRKVQTYFLILLVFFSALAEIVSLGAVIPFIGVITSPEIVFEYSLIQKLSSIFGLTSPDQLIKPVTILFCVAALLAGIIRASLLWLSTKLAFSGGSDLSVEVYRRTLYQPYKVHVSRNSSEVISGIISKLNGVITWVLFPVLAMISSFFLLIAITTTLLLINPSVALFAIFGFGISYLFITFISRNRLLKNANLEAKEQNQVVKTLQEGLGGIRDVLLSGNQIIYTDTYRRSDKPLRQAQGNNVFIGQSPRFAMEALGMILIAGIALTLTSTSQSNANITEPLQILGVLAFAAQRLLPALQQIYTGWSSLVGHKTAINDVLDLLDQPDDLRKSISEEPPLAYDRSIQIKKMSFKYVDNSDWIVEDLNLTIPKGARVGFVGTTGSGKSTTLDLLMGLLVPNEGELIIDGKSINYDNIRSWQDKIAHVPQNIYLSDNSFKENIAFGVASSKINHNLVKESAHLAQIDEYISSQPEGYESYVGERGVLLSGGQKQRIGIARALYQKAQVLIFDEATSALDNATERQVMQSIGTLNKELTIIIIAHRLTTVRDCDIIFEMENGKLISQGTYDELLISSRSFKEMTQNMNQE